MGTDAVVLPIGYRPKMDLAQKAGAEINTAGFVVTDQFTRTSLPDCFDKGDCSEKRDFLTGKIRGIMLASTTCAGARVTGLNLFALSAICTFRGTIGIYSTSIRETACGVAGLNEVTANSEGFDVVVGSFAGVDTHPD